VGLTEEQVKARNMKVRKGKTIFRGNGRAQSLGEGEGFIKVLAEDTTGRIVGVMAIGHLVSELIDAATLAVSLRLTARQVTGVIHAHPTLSEAFAEACSQIA
jgi:dihydrolipoamide dehydrogenase